MGRSALQGACAAVDDRPPSLVGKEAGAGRTRMEPQLERVPRSALGEHDGNASLYADAFVLARRDAVGLRALVLARPPGDERGGTGDGEVPVTWIVQRSNRDDEPDRALPAVMESDSAGLAVAVQLPKGLTAAVHRDGHRTRCGPGCRPCRSC